MGWSSRFNGCDTLESRAFRRFEVFLKAYLLRQLVVELRKGGSHNNNRDSALITLDLTYLKVLRAMGAQTPPLSAMVDQVSKMLSYETRSCKVFPNGRGRFGVRHSWCCRGHMQVWLMTFESLPDAA